MLIFPNIDPVAAYIGPLTIYWYGVLYLISFLAGLILCIKRKLTTTPSWEVNQVYDLFFYIALGVIFGGRIGYVLLYRPDLLANDPLTIVKFWELGRSFHGGLIGVLLGIFIYGRQNHRLFFSITDFIAPIVPLGIALGRLGNFINGELWGRVTDVAWGMIFPHVDMQPRHPSQLYELFLEGIILFIGLYWYSRKPRLCGMVSGWFLLCYGSARTIIELFRQPDFGHDLLFGVITKGQIFSIPMVLIGLVIIYFATRGNKCNNI